MITYLPARDVRPGDLLHTESGLVTVTDTDSDGVDTGLCVIDYRGLHLPLVFASGDVLSVVAAHHPLSAEVETALSHGLLSVEEAVAAMHSEMGGAWWDSREMAVVGV